MLGGCYAAMGATACAERVLRSDDDVGDYWSGAEQQWGHGCALGGCCAAMGTWLHGGWLLDGNEGMGVCVVCVRVGQLLRSNGRNGVRWVGAEQQCEDVGDCWAGDERQWGHGCVLGGCCAAVETWLCVGWALNGNVKTWVIVISANPAEPLR